MSGRKKVPLEPGHSMMDWMKLTSSGNNLRGITGPMRKVTMQELRQHCTEKDAWMALRGTVYNITPYLKFHPGGIHELMRGAGADGTYLFDEVHRWVNLEGMMRPTVVGTLDVKRGALGTIEQGATTFASCSVLDVKHHNHNAVQFDLQLSEKISLGLGQHIRLRTKGEYGRIVIREYTPIAPLTTDATDRISLLVKLYPEGTMSDILQGLLDASTNVMTPIDKTTTTTTTSITTTTTATITDTTAAPAYSFTMSTTAPEPVSDGPTPVISPPAPAVAVTPESSRSKEDVVASREMSCSQPCGSIFSYKDMVQGKARLGILAAGTGLTAFMRIVPAYLAESSTEQVCLLYANSTLEDRLCLDQLEAWSKDSHFTAEHLISQADSAWAGRKGRLTREVVEQVLPKPSADTFVLVCGPPAFNGLAAKFLTQLGYDEHMFHIFA